ncbi:ABC transporter permease [Paenibacillus sp. Aloe-11]|uniref:ABC transporter permease n=1 Tax=Paenibacillus sp. Aloe-11 TaxID=1050222 RepID=UPI00024EF679|nr:ABC transporter permease [Paenibacillus sp. Aloe-11]EHS55643.1 putative permease component of ABC transporter [Paenibacillus sp. Aloe-11]
MNRLAYRVVDWITPKSKSWVTPLLLLLPSLLLMGFIFIGSLLIFSRYSLDSFEGGRLQSAFQWTAYRTFLTDPYYWKVIRDTFWLTIRVTLISLLLAYPLAYYTAHIRSSGWRQTVLLITFLPLLVSAVVKSYAWLVLLSRQGLLNWLLIRTGIAETGLEMTFNETGVIIALVHIFLPFMVIPILSVLVQQDRTLKAAAHDLGAGSLRTFLTITLPLSVRGIVSGVQIVFTLCLTAFTTPALIGGGRVMTLPTFIYQRTLDTNWPIAAVASLFLIIASTLAVWLLNRLGDFLTFQRSGKGGAADAP